MHQRDRRTDGRTDTGMVRPYIRYVRYFFPITYVYAYDILPYVDLITWRKQSRPKLRTTEVHKSQLLSVSLILSQTIFKNA